MTTEVMIGIVALGVLVVLVGLRAATRGRLEVKLTDAVIALIPVVLWLLVSGKITKLAVGTEGISVETAREAIVEASAQAIDDQVSPLQVSPLPVDPVESAAKGPVGDIPGLIRDGVQGLTFGLGFGGYVGFAVQEHLVALSRYPFFRYVIFDNADGSLFGMIDARELSAFVVQDPRVGGWDGFAQMINAADAGALAELPGFVPAGSAVPANADKRDALARMEELEAQWLPVTDESGRLVGVVERSRLTASLILDVATRLAGAGQ